MSNWTLKWPKEPGLYLFYGGFHGMEPHMHLCRVEKTAVPGRMAYVATTHFLYPSESFGAFRPFDEKPPDLEAMKRA